MNSLLSLLLLAALSGGIHAQEITNPVWPQDCADPTIWKGEDGRYHCISTNPRHSLVSDDLFHWEMAEQTPVDDISWDQMGDISRHYWAPDVTTVDGQRLMYISLYNSAEDSNIGVLRQNSLGQFQYMGVITRGKLTGIHDTIDPEVVTDPKTGKVWLFFGSVGGIHRIELEKDGLSLKEGAKYEHVAGLKVEQNRDRSHVFEGAYLHWHKGYWYLFVSSGFYSDHTYKLQVGRAKKLTDDFVNRDGKPMKEGHATPVIWSDKGDRFYGPGHCGEIFTGKDGNEYIFYHCHNADNRNRSSRPLFISRIQWDKQGWPFVEGGKPQ